jgi:tRNA G10  N-methylase Trm11
LAKLFFLISGEYESLSFAELKAILEAEKFTYVVTEKLDQTARIETDTKSIAEILRRSAYTRTIAQELFTSDDSDEAISRAAQNTDFTQAIKQG